MITTLLLALTAPTLPVLESGGPKPGNYPEIKNMWEEDGTVVVTLLVAPTGRVVRCGLLRPSGTEELDGTTCAVFLIQSRYTPARDVAGNPAYAEITTAVTWRMWDRSAPTPSRLPALFDVTVARLPGGEAGPVRVPLVLGIDEAGGLTSCSPAPEVDGQTKGMAALNAVACRQAHGVWTPLPMLSETGRPVPYLKSASVEFAVG